MDRGRQTYSSISLSNSRPGRPFTAQPPHSVHKSLSISLRNKHEIIQTLLKHPIPKPRSSSSSPSPEEFRKGTLQFVAAQRTIARSFNAALRPPKPCATVTRVRDVVSVQATRKIPIHCVLTDRMEDKTGQSSTSGPRKQLSGQIDGDVWKSIDLTQKARPRSMSPLSCATCKQGTLLAQQALNHLRTLSQVTPDPADPTHERLLSNYRAAVVQADLGFSDTPQDLLTLHMFEWMRENMPKRVHTLLRYSAKPQYAFPLCKALERVTGMYLELLDCIKLAVRTKEEFLNVYGGLFAVWADSYMQSQLSWNQESKVTKVVKRSAKKNIRAILALGKQLAALETGLQS